MGQPKQLLPVRGRAAVRYCVETILAAGITDVVVVVGANGRETEAALEGLPVRIVRNPDQNSDMAGSVRTGLNAVSPASRSVLIALADHPLVTSDTISLVLAESRKHSEHIIIPRYQDRRGHPTLFPRALINEVLGEGNLRDVIKCHAAQVYDLGVDDEGVALDMDTEEDYENIRLRAGESR
jgi:molybdenum cofactor cytidylyltransferase